MNVKQLIKELKGVPQNLVVEVALNDNMKHETAGSACYIFHFVKDDYDVESMSMESERAFEDMPDECVIIRC